MAAGGEYIDVSWIHDNLEYPIRLVSELDQMRFEVRKLEFFRDGRVAYADGEYNTGAIKLGIEPVPGLPAINAQAEFRGTSISKEVFEELWLKYGRGSEG